MVPMDGHDNTQRESLNISKVPDDSNVDSHRALSDGEDDKEFAKDNDGDAVVPEVETKKSKCRACIDKLYLIRLRLVLKIDAEMGALIISLLVKFLMYASDIRISLDQMPGAWHEMKYSEKVNDTVEALNTNFVFVCVSFLVFVAQFKVGKILNGSEEADYINQDCTGIDEEKIKEREKLIKIDWYLTQLQIAITLILIVVQSIIMYQLDLAGGCVSKWSFQLSVILKAFSIIEEEIGQLHFDAVAAQFRLAV